MFIRFNRHVYGKAYHNSYFGRGQDLAVYSHVRCNGTEIDLLHCLLQQGGTPQCDHTKDIGISCFSMYGLVLNYLTIILNINTNGNRVSFLGYGCLHILF